MRPHYGGQALVEGVLIRGTDRWAMALRRPDGELHLDAGHISPASGLWRRPFMRGLHTLASTFRVGWMALIQSSQMESIGEIRPLPRFFLAWLVGVSVVIGLVVFALIPLLLTGRPAGVEPDLPARLAEGGVKSSFLAVYVLGVTRMSRFRRLFSYHGAEHMAIACSEAGLPLTRENVARFNPAHPRCGTGFLVILASVDTLLLALLPRFGEIPDMALRIGFLPVTAAVAYELLRWGARQQGIGSALTRFGLLTQRLTTARPDAGQIDVAIAALRLCQNDGSRAVAVPA
jgi:uncharacterized protein YqhQ